MNSTSALTGMLLCLLTAAAAAAETNDLALVPWPQQVSRQPGVFSLTRDTTIQADSASSSTADVLAGRLRPSTGYPLPIRGPRRSQTGAILLTTRGADPHLGAEGYLLTVAPDAVVIRAPNQAGLFYGVQTLLQLLPLEVFATQSVSDVSWQIPCVEIRDWPRFPWRGLMLDVSRHFFKPSEVEQILDAMAQQKLNRFHWHLTDDQGWRIQIPKYPKLTEIGAWRSGVGFGLDPKSTTAYGPEGRYGGFYTEQDIRRVVKYAAARHILIVPEIEMPGHSTAALAAYPQYSCTGGPFTIPLKGGVFDGIYDPSNEQTFRFLQDVLSEVFKVFPGQYVHLGGDEVPKETWTNSASCRALMKREGLADADELQSWFMKRMEKYVSAHGRTMIGWSEILKGGLASNAVVMDWIGGASESATSGHDVVMTPTRYCYLDMYQSTNRSKEPRAIGGFIPLERTYSFEPIPTNLPPQFHHHILGAQGNLWTEYVPNLKHAEYMIFPRLTALAEVDWSPKSARDFASFSRRLQVEFQRFDRMGVHYRPNLPRKAQAPESNE